MKTIFMSNSPEKKNDPSQCTDEDEKDEREKKGK